MNTQIIEIEAETILRPTGIDLASHVVNPYQGCALGCCFCYAQFSKVAKREQMQWGSYVKVKTNALDLLRQELELVKPNSVLLGSTTECFQPVEKQYGLTRGILEILNEQKITFTLMSRSQMVEDYMHLLNQGNTKSVYFTIDTLPDSLRNIFCMQGPDFDRGLDVASNLMDNNVPVTGYFCPIMPWISKVDNIIEKAKGRILRAEFEIMNLQMAGEDKILNTIEKIYPESLYLYKNYIKNRNFFIQTIEALDQKIKQQAEKNFEYFRVHASGYEEYFANRYT